MGILSVIIVFLLLGALWFAAVLNEHDIHPMRKMAEWMRRCSVLEVALVAIMAAGPIYRAGSKTNGVPDRGCSPVPGSAFRVEVVSRTRNPQPETRNLPTTNYQLPTTNLDWLASGGYEDWFYLDGGGWCFRFGSNLVERLTVFSCGEISPAPYDASNRISLLGLPLAILPAANWHLLGNGGQGTGNGEQGNCQLPTTNYQLKSLFCHEETPSNTLLLTWRNALVNRDTDLPVTVQAELFPDGAAAFRYDFSGIGDINALSNAEAQIWRDGVLASNYQLPTIDYQLSTTNYQLSSFFDTPPITGTNGIAEVYARIAGGNSNAYYCADVVVEKGPAKIRVEPMEDETNRGLLGAYEIVAMPGETNRLPLLIGPKYTVTAESAFGAFELVPPPFVPLADDTGTVERLEFGDALTLTNITDRLVEIQWPVEFALEEIDAAPEATTYALRITPDWLDGVVTWHGIVDTNAPPMRGAPPMRSGGDSCSCGCLVRDGLDLIHSQICSCEHCSAEGECLYEGHSESISLDMKDSSSGGGGGNSPGGNGSNPPDPDLPSVSVSFEKDVLIFEAPYEVEPGIVTNPPPSTRTKLTLHAYGGENGGTLTLNPINGLKLVQGSVPMPTSVAAYEAVQWEGYYEATNASPCQGGAVAKPVFVEYQTGKRVPAKAARATAIKITVEPEKRAPGNQARGRHTLGVCEKVNCTQSPDVPQVTWTALGGYFDDDIITRGGPGKVYNCPLYADNNMLQAGVGDVSYTPLLTVVQPQGVTTGAVQKLSIESQENQAGLVGMAIELYVLPLTVSFAYTKIEEVPSDQGTHCGYFGNPGLSRWWYHTTGNGAGKWSNVETNNFFMIDHAKMDEEMYQIQPEGMEPSGWTDGTIVWHVPYGWKSQSDHVLQPLGGTFATNVRQTFHITTNGTVSIEKHGNVISRGTNNVVTLNGVIQNGQ